MTTRTRRHRPPKRWDRFEHRTDLYARRVLGDTRAGALIVAGPLVRLACERHLRDRTQAATKKGHPGGWRFSKESADDCIEFFENVLRLPDQTDPGGERPRFLLEPAQAFWTGSLMGWLGADGKRRFREAYIEAGKGSGKSPWLAGLGLFGLIMDGERGAQVYAAAATRGQAGVIFNMAVGMVECSPDLVSSVQLRQAAISYKPLWSFFRAYSRDQGKLSGVIPHFILFDEVHELPSAEIMNKLRAGVKGRDQPLSVSITNSGYDRTSICWQHHEHAEHVVRGTVEDDRLFSYVCALDEGDDPMTDEDCWIKTNPLLGVTIKKEYLRRQVENANNIPHELNEVLRLNFCIWTESRERAIDMAAWRSKSCVEVISDEELVGMPCYAGLDLGQSDDFTAFVLIWDLGDGRVAVRSRFWIPAAALERYPNRSYGAWRDMDKLEITEGNTTNYDVVEAAVAADCLAAGVREVAYDKKFAEQMAQHLQGAGETMVNTPQGFGLTEACRKLGELIADGKLCHGDDPVLTWMAGNLVFQHGRYDEIRPDKDTSGEKMDGMVALIMALTRLIAEPVEPEIDPEVGVLVW